mgnify:CR=1 FL=1
MQVDALGNAIIEGEYYGKSHLKGSTKYIIIGRILPKFRYRNIKNTNRVSLSTEYTFQVTKGKKYTGVYERTQISVLSYTLFPVDIKKIKESFFKNEFCTF